ncbi:MAG: hypothetical protein SCK70_05380 [bacterium]|nr:hypothetical protein [bacterium]
MVLSFFVFLREPNYPYIFLNLAIFSLFYLSGFVVIFSGVDYLFGDDKLPYILWAYRKIIISVMTCIMVIYIPTSYIFNNVKSSYRYLISFVIVLPISAFYFKSFLLDWKYIFNELAQYELLSGVVGMNFLAIFLIGIYGLVYFIQLRPVSSYINLILFSTLIFLVIDINDNYFIIENKALPIISQVFLLVNLLAFILILSHKLMLMDNDFTRFYENLLERKINLTIKIVPKKAISQRVVNYLKFKFRPLANKICSIVLMVVALFFFLYFYPFGYEKMNLLILFIIFLILLMYLVVLVRRRSKRIQYLTQNNSEV